ncbi:MAG: N-acetylmuramoyl-L-alanine amidase [Bacteroidetes bacterium]|nr:N-acetylmuramoyl-L-alanine amidase [Bacteroidota bacterium]
MRIVIAFLLTLGIFMLLPSAGVKPHAAGSTLKTIVLDAGHGGQDPGCNGAGEIWEKNVTLAITLKLGKLLEDSMKDVKVVYTRKTDKFVELWERPNQANKDNADLFISIHCNANNNTAAAGSETYFMGLHKTSGNLEVSKRENSVITYESDYKTNERYGGFDPNSPESHIIFTLVQNAFLQQSLKFSQMVENQTGAISKVKSRGIKQAGFLVLWQTAMPSVLVETGFLTNASDRAVLKSEEGQKIIAKGIYKAIVAYKKELEKSAAIKAEKKNTATDSTKSAKNIR